MEQTRTTSLRNNQGQVIGHLETDLPTGTVTAFWHPKPRTLAEDHPTPRLPARVRTCGHCGADYELVRDASGALMPCDNCGKGWKDGALLEIFAAPDTLGRVVALQRDPVRVAETTSVPVTSVFVAVPTVRTTQAPRTSTLDGVVAYQMAQGLRDPGPQRLHTSATVRCPRCNAPDFRTCACPPTPPDTLAIAVQRNQERDQRQAAALLAAHPKLEHWD